jgi:hypothetical protein
VPRYDLAGLVAEVSAADRRLRGREVFVGPRLRASVAPSLRARSALVLLLMSVFVGAVLAAGLAVGVWFVVQGLLHTVGTGS